MKMEKEMKYEVPEVLVMLAEVERGFEGSTLAPGEGNTPGFEENL